MHGTPVKSLMAENLIMIDPEASLCEAARKMKDTNCGSLLVGTDNKPDGIITDRDIVVRATAQNLDPAAEKVSDHMTGILLTCEATDTLADAAERMRAHSVSRLIVNDADGRTCGILSFGHILRNHSDDNEVAEVVARATGRRSPANSDGDAGSQ